MHKDDFIIEVNNKVLSVSSERKEEKKQEIIAGGSSAINLLKEVFTCGRICLTLIKLRENTRMAL
jgi:hypothetical protein